jgi:hypothetical protein
MSFGDKLVLWLHIAFAIFTIGPLALAISSTPRYIRRRDVSILRYLSRITLIFTATSLLVLVFGIVLGDLDRDFSHAWLSVAMTLFVVALVLLALIIRDQRRAIKALTHAQAAGSGSSGGGQAADPAAGPAHNGPADAEHGQATESAAYQPGGEPATAAHTAMVERGRIAALGGVVNLIWLAILVLMVWQP